MEGPLIIIGLTIWYLWASDIRRGKQDARHKRRIHDHPIGGCFPFVVAFGLIAVGIYMIFNK